MTLALYYHYEEEFIQRIISDIIPQLLESKCNHKQLIKFTAILNHDCLDILRMIVVNLKFKHLTWGYLIYVDYYTVFEGMKLVDIAKFINYGNTTTEGYPIFTTIFNILKFKINDYYWLYQRGDL